jgi:hypothetical protein
MLEHQQLHRRPSADRGIDGGSSGALNGQPDNEGGGNCRYDCTHEVHT